MPSQVSQELIEDLVEIGRLQNDAPLSFRGEHHELGLYVQMHSRTGQTTLKAGGRFLSKVELWRESPSENWRVKKYKPGEWERLVKPTLEWAKWVNRLIWQHEAVKESVVRIKTQVQHESTESYEAWLLKAKHYVLKKYLASSIPVVDSFKREGILELPSSRNLDWVEMVTGIGVEFNELRMESEEIFSGLQIFHASAVIEDEKISEVLEAAKNNVEKLEYLLEEMARLHEQLKTTMLPDQWPALIAFYVALMTAFLCAISRAEATKKMFEVVLETRGVVQEKEDDFAEAGAKKISYSIAEKEEIAKSIMMLDTAL